MRFLATAATAAGLLFPAAASADTFKPGWPFGGDVPASAADKAKKEANRISRRHLGYVLGGGHTASRPAGPRHAGGYDCSGSVSRVLWKAGLLKSVRTADGFLSWGHRGKGPITVYASSGHVWMTIYGRAFGTSSQNPGGGPGWFHPSRSYRAGFEPRTTG